LHDIHRIEKWRSCSGRIHSAGFRLKKKPAAFLLIVFVSLASVLQVSSGQSILSPLVYSVPGQTSNRVWHWAAIGSSAHVHSGTYAAETGTRGRETRAAGKSSSGRCETFTSVLGCGVYPSDDTFTDNLLPTTIMEAEIGSALIVQNVPSVPVSRNFAFLRFNLTSILPQTIFTSHAKPFNASLWLYSRYVNGFQNASVSVYRVPSNEWNESTLTWDDMPSIDTSHHETVQIIASNAWYYWNVTDDVRKALQITGAISFALVANDKSWRNYALFDSKEHPQNVSTSPELDLYFLEPTLTLITAVPHLSMSVDNRTLQADANGTLQIHLPWGVHQLSVPQVIPQGNGVRNFLVSWSDNVSSASREINIGNNETFGINYRTQYYLDVISPYAATNGSGWYFEGEKAKATVQSLAVFHEGLLGFLGVRRVFDGWTGDCSSRQIECTLTMTGPKQATALWREDYALTFFACSVVAVGAVVAIIQRKRFTRRKRRRST
jgi:hypothetical protein